MLDSSFPFYQSRRFEPTQTGSARAWEQHGVQLQYDDRTRSWYSVWKLILSSVFLDLCVPKCCGKLHAFKQMTITVSGALFTVPDPITARLSSHLAAMLKLWGIKSTSCTPHRTSMEPEGRPRRDSGRAKRPFSSFVLAGSVKLASQHPSHWLQVYIRPTWRATVSESYLLWVLGSPAWTPKVCSVVAQHH